jgi:ribosomal protein L30E
MGKIKKKKEKTAVIAARIPEKFKKQLYSYCKKAKVNVSNYILLLIASQLGINVKNKK